jgi:hypothetical protein
MPCVFGVGHKLILRESKYNLLKRAVQLSDNKSDIYEYSEIIIINTFRD